MDHTSQAQWEKKGYSLPQYDIQQMTEATKENPFWIHFGAGNLFRAFHAVIVQNLLNKGKLDRGILVAEGFDYEIIEKMYVPHDNLGIAVTLKADGTIDKTIVGSIAEALPLDSANELVFARLKGIFANDSLQMATFTITEKGYSLTDAKGELLADASADFAAGPENLQATWVKYRPCYMQDTLRGKNPLRWSVRTTVPTTAINYMRQCRRSPGHGLRTRKQMQDLWVILIPKRFPSRGQ